MAQPKGIVAGLLRFFLVFTLGILPIFFLPVTQNFYDTAKWILLIAAALLTTFLATFQLLLTGSLGLLLSPAAGRWGLLFLAALISLLAASTNRVEATIVPWGAATFGALWLLFFAGSPYLTPGDKRRLRSCLLLAATVAGLVAIIQFFGWSKPFVSQFPFLADPLWTPLGGGLALVLFLLLLLPLAVEDLLLALRSKSILTLLARLLGAAAMVVGLVLTLYQLWPSWPRLLLPLPAGWAITLESLKNPRQLLWGVGAENFISAFTAGRPLTLNQTPAWNLLFAASSSPLLHLAVTWGLVGVAALLFLVHLLLRQIRLAQITTGKAPVTALSISFLTGVVFLLIAPPVYPVLLTLASLLALSQEAAPYHLHLSSRLNWLKVGLVLVLLGLVTTAGYWAGRVYAAEVVFYRSLLTGAAGRGRDTYNLQIKALNLMPQISRYHIVYSQTNLALASSLARPLEGSDKPQGLSDQDRQTVTALVQQAIREGKIAVQLAPKSVMAWENLANIYQSLIPVATDSDTWTIATLQEAIALNPTNPLLRLSLGGIYVGQKNYDQAINLFLTAARLKPDYANAYYNLANTWKLKGNTAEAVRALEKTLTLIAPGTSDYTKAQNELEALKREVASPEASPAAETSLTKPAPPQPVVVPPLTLPTDSGPTNTSEAAQAPL